MSEEKYTENISISDKTLLRLRNAQERFLGKTGIYPTYSEVIGKLLDGWGL